MTIRQTLNNLASDMDCKGRYWFSHLCLFGHWILADKSQHDISALRKIDDTEMVPLDTVWCTSLQKGTASACLFHTKIVPQGHWYSAPLQDGTIFDLFCSKNSALYPRAPKYCPFSKRAPFSPFFWQQKRWPFFSKRALFQKTVPSWPSLPTRNCFGAFFFG